ncbi:hypothetical protein [Cloacibacterium normanense]
MTKTELAPIAATSFFLDWELRLQEKDIAESGMATKKPPKNFEGYFYLLLSA